MSKISKKFNEKWIREEINDTCIQFMEELGLFLCDKKERDRYPGRNAVTTTQMRNIFSEVKRIEVRLNHPSQWQKEQTKVLLLKPKIAYNTARVLTSKRESRMTDLREVLEKGIDAVIGAEDKFNSFKRFSQFFEGIIAYHKVYGGKD